MRTFLALVSVIGGACGDGGPDLPPDAFIPQPGRVSVRWTVSTPDGPSTCEEVGATHVLLRLGTTSGDEFQDVFPCNAYQGTTDLHEPRLYFGQLELVDMFGGLYSSSLETNVYIPPDGSTVMMEDVDFVVQPFGGFTLRVDTGEPGGNCEGGSGITGVSFHASNAAGACLTRNVVVQGHVETYPTMCIVDESNAPCVAADQVITLDNLPAGSYDFSVSGWIGAPEVDCFEARAHIDLPPGQTVDVGVVTWERATTAACAP